MYDVVTFGEAMIRLSSPEYRRLENATKLDVEVGGGEYNVAVGCAHLGLKAAWVSRLVDNWTGWIIRNKGREHGVDMSNVVWVKFDGVGLERNGFYHMEVGVGPRASAVTYDRGHSAKSDHTAEHFCAVAGAKLADRANRRGHSLDLNCFTCDSGNTSGDSVRYRTGDHLLGR